MLRAVIFLLILIIAVTFLRAAIGLIARAMSQAIEPEKAQSPAGGELKRDPVCGTYIAESAAVQKTVDGKVLHFCSPSCRDRYPS